ncbi:pantetheine-phosphate adenylyltransferase [Acetobacteraceae bacterium]|nr:pantetheine-phosphate adenylyltransferase [Acetobacteraceae bacterium]
MRVGFYSGTFDPVTFGHLDIIERASTLFDRLIIGVATNDGKHPLLGLEERIALVRDGIKNFPMKERISVIGFSDLLVNAMQRENAGTVIRGLRCAGDFDFETQLSAAIKRLAPEIETIFLLASEGQRATSSRIVKEISRLGGDVSAFTTDKAKEALLMKKSLLSA